MGAKDSKPSCISYEDALKRVSESEIRRITDAFKKSAGAGSSTLSKNAFLQDVLSEGVPQVLAESLYGACGGHQQRGIAFKELFCGLVLLTRGTDDEKIKFLWNVYCNESNTHILKADFANALHTESTYQPAVEASLLLGTAVSSATGSPVHAGAPATGGAPPPVSLSHTSYLISLFGQSDRVTYEQFRNWIHAHKRATVLSKWLLLESGVTQLSTELETPTFFQSLAGVTHLEELDIVDLEKVFWTLKGSGQLDVEALGTLVSPPVPWAALRGVFAAFDENRDGHIDFKELCCGVSAACRGPSVERSKFCFKVFDLDGDGVLNFNEIREMCNILLFVACESNNSAAFRSLSVPSIVDDLRARQQGGRTPTPDHPNSTSDDAKQPADDRPFTFTQEDFMMWSVQSSVNLVQPFLDLLFEVCHVVLGLRPQCRHLEYDIVKGWLARETARGYRVGQFWYLVSADWYQNWLQYTQQGNSSSSGASSCTYCKTSASAVAAQLAAAYHHQRQISGAGVDEAVVCDESFTSNSTESMGDLLGNGAGGGNTADSSSLGSGSSGISMGRNSHSPPGIIDNGALVDGSAVKNVQTLTGEGGRLKMGIKQHRDYELIPKSLWDALAQWYKGPLPLPRQVIQPPHQSDVQLELYPLNIRILRHAASALPAGGSSAAGGGGTTIVQPVSPWGAVAGGYGTMSGTTGYGSSNALPQPPKRYLAYTAAFSRLATVKQVGDFLCQRLKLKSEDVRVWHVYGVGDASLLEEEQCTLEDLQIADNDQFLLEIRNKDLTWPEELGSLGTSGSSASGSTVHQHQDRRATLASIQSVHPPGATGLHNLGNTCFMNAALQVLFNTQPLTQYFRQNMHMYELNTTNKLGTKGQLALRYAELLREVWSATTRSVAPLKLRFCMTKNAPQFAGGGQHDSQELLEWLLDALHEDLNRVMEKPYAELKDSDGRPDEVVAAEAWQQHHARNQSIVSDLFYGQLKSKVSCLVCGRDSVRFDPFSLLSLPLPVENYTYCEALVVRLDGSVPVKYGLRLNSDSRYADLKRDLSALCGLHPTLMLVCELNQSQIHCALSDGQRLKASTATDLHVYEVPKGDFWRRPRTSSELGVSIEHGLKDIQRNPAGDPNTAANQSNGSASLSGSSTSLSNQSPVGNGRPIPTKTTALMSGSIGGVERSAKQPTELSTSPESTFIQMRRRSSVGTNLLTLKEANNRSNSAGHSGPTMNKIAEHVDGHINDDEVDADDAIDASRIADSAERLSAVADEADEAGQRLASRPTAGTAGDSTPAAHFGGYLIAVHRKLSRQDTYFLSYHKTRPSLFGVPLLIPCYEGGSNKDLYCAVWMQVARLLSPLPSTPPDQSNHATDCDDSLGYEFPFTLRAVTEGGRVCALCSWSKFCRGCEIPCNDEPLLRGAPGAANTSSSSSSSSCNSTPQLPTARIHSATDASALAAATAVDSLATWSSTAAPLFSQTAAMNAVHSSAIHIAIDWDPTALHLRYQSNRERLWTEHESVAVCRRQQTEPVDIDHCLRAFTSVEKLEQWYKCAHCKAKKPATKKLQIWRLPPILIVHLKRFNFVNNKWVKSQKVVNFPFQNFDATPYLASVPQETILRHKELLEHHGSLHDPLQSSPAASAPQAPSAAHVPAELDIAENGDAEAEATEADETTVSKPASSTVNANSITTKTPPPVAAAMPVAGVAMRKKSSAANSDGSPTRASCVSGQSTARRKRLVSTSLTQTPVIDGEFNDFHKHHLVDGQDPYDLNYKLYAVVSHSGMLNGGHYISYASNPSQTWYCYNDSSCREIAGQPNIDPGSAYLLFYERKGLDYAPYLPKVDGRQLPNGSAAAAAAAAAAVASNGGSLGTSGYGGIPSALSASAASGISNIIGTGATGPPTGPGGALNAAVLDDVDPELRKTCTIS